MIERNTAKTLSNIQKYCMYGNNLLFPQFSHKEEKKKSIFLWKSLKVSSKSSFIIPEGELKISHDQQLLEPFYYEQNINYSRYK